MRMNKPYAVSYTHLVFECLFHSDLPPDEKYEQSQWLNKLFAGEYAFDLTKTICHVDFERNESSQNKYRGDGDIAVSYTHLG